MNAPPPKLSIASYSFHRLILAEMMDVFGYLESVRFRYHLDTADIWNRLLGKDPAAYSQPEFLKKVTTGLRERNLDVCNYHADGCHLWEADASVREKHRQLRLQHLAVAEALGATTVRIDAGGRDRTWSPEQFDLIVAGYRELARRAHDGGYRIGPEVHWGTELYPEEMTRLARTVDSPGFGILVHLGRYPEVSPDEGDRMLAPFAMHVHLDPATIASRLTSALAILRGANYSGYLGIESAIEGDEHANLAIQIGLIRKAMAEPLNA